MTRAWSCVAYLNSLPYLEGLRRLAPRLGIRLLVDPPFRCAERLRSGEAEAALVPSIEFARIPGAVPAGDFGIASLHEVRSVVLLSRRPLGEVRTVAVDANSRTSVALLKILFARQHGIRPDLATFAPEPGEMLRRCDAALLIGDAALKAPRDGYEVLDLAEAWHRMTGLPFVFALWAARTPGDAAGAAPILEEALVAGLEALREAAPREAAAAGIPVADLLDYLSRNIHFRLGGAERESLALYLRLCREEGILGVSPGSS